MCDIVMFRVFVTYVCLYIFVFFFFSSLFFFFLGERSYTQGELQTVQYGAIVGQVNHAHQPPTVSY